MEYVQHVSTHKVSSAMFLERNNYNFINLVHGMKNIMKGNKKK